MTTVESRPETVDTDTFVERLFGSVLATMDLQSVYLGDRLGYYRALGEGPLTSPELAARTGTAERYAREWLEQQAVTGILTVEDDPVDADAEGSTRRFSLPPAHAEVLTDADSLEYLAPLGRFV